MSNKSMSAFKIKKIISFSLLALFLASFILPFTASAQIVMPIREIKRTVGSTTFSFQGQIVDTPPKITPTLYFYYAKNTESTAGAIDATRIEITTSPPGNDFTILLGIGGITALTPDTDYTFIITDQNPVETIGGAYTVKMFDSFHTKKTGESATSSSTELPAVTTNSTAINIIVNAGTVRGTITGTDSSSKVWFKYGIKESALDKTTSQAVKTKDGEFSATIGGLTEKITIYFKACGKNTKGESCGNTYSFYPSITGGTGPDTDETTTTTSTPVETELNYYPLAPLPGVGEECAVDKTGKTICVHTGCTLSVDKKSCTPAENCTLDKDEDGNVVCTQKVSGFGNYLNVMINLFIGICAVLAMIMIIMGGIQYMTSELISGKEEGKKKVTQAVLGLLLALGSYAILNTINPDLLDVSLSGLPTATVTVGEETTEKTIGVKGDTTTVDGQTITACDEKEMVPVTLFGSKIRGGYGMNKAVVDDLTAINAKWEKCQTSTDSACTAIKNYTPIVNWGGYVCNTVKGSSSEYYSAHAFGIAVDINIYENPYVLGATDATCVTDMPAEFVKLFTDQGWGWGGNWTGLKDAMHFSKLSTEINGTGTCVSTTGASAPTSTTEKITAVNLTKYSTNTLQFWMDLFNSKRTYSFRITTTGGTELVPSQKIIYNTTNKTLKSTITDAQYANLHYYTKSVTNKEIVYLYYKNKLGNDELINSFKITIKDNIQE